MLTCNVATYVRMTFYFTVLSWGVHPTFDSYCPPGNLLRCFRIGTTWPCSTAAPIMPYPGELMKLKMGNHINPIVSKQVADVLTGDNMKVGRANLILE